MELGSLLPQRIQFLLFGEVFSITYWISEYQGSMMLTCTDTEFIISLVDTFFNIFYKYILWFLSFGVTVQLEMCHKLLKNNCQKLCDDGWYCGVILGVSFDDLLTFFVVTLVLHLDMSWLSYRPWYAVLTFSEIRICWKNRSGKPKIHMKQVYCAIFKCATER